MDSPNFSRIQQIFEQALDLEPADRAAFLGEACGDDAELRARVEELLAADAELDEFLEPPQGFGLPVDKLRAEARDFLPEEEIGGYQLLRELGRGGRGVVYLAREPETGALVALKVLGSGLLPSAVAVERFRREAKANARVDHPSIVKLRLSGDDTGRPFLVMDYIGGHTLADEILLQRSQSEAIELPEHLQGRAPVLPTEERARLEASVRLVQQMAEALHHAHERGVLHRDVKPQNVLLDEDGRPHLIDFGLADVQGEMSLTRTGEVEGTPNYMSPEQVRALKGGIDLRTDVYSLGVVLYELLTLRRPFDAPTVNQVMQNITRTMPPRIRRVVPSVPTTLELICTTAIEKRPEHRYPSMAIFASDLDAFLQSRPLQAKAPSPLTRVMRRVRRRPMPYAVGLAVVVALVLGLGAGEAVARWSAMREIRSLLAAVDAKSGFDPNREYATVFESVDSAREREWSLPRSLRDQVDELRSEADAHLRSQIASLVPELGGPFEYGIYQLTDAEGEWVDVPSWIADQQPSWRRWGIPESVQANLASELRRGSLVLQFDPPEIADGVVIQLREVEFPLVSRPQQVDTVESTYLPGIGIAADTTYHGRIRYPDGEVGEFTALPVASGQFRRLIVRKPSRAFDFVEFDGGEIPRDFPSVAVPASNGKKIDLLDAFALGSGYVSVEQFEAWVSQTGAYQVFRDAYLPEFPSLELLARPICAVQNNEAAACAAWYGYRIPLAEELAVAFGEFGDDGRPVHVNEAQFGEFVANLPYFTEDILENQSELLVGLLPEANEPGPLGAHPSGVSSWYLGLFEVTGTASIFEGAPAAPSFGAATVLFAGVKSNSALRPPWNLHHHPALG